MTVSVQDVMTPVTRQEAEASIYSAMATVGVDTTSWRPGAVARTIIKAVAILFAAATRLIAAVARGGFLELAEGAWLTLLARHQYGIERFEATFGTGTLTLTNAGGGLFELDPGDLIVRNPASDRTYTNVSAVRLGAGGSATFSIIAQEPGSASTAGIGTIVEFVTPLVNVTCSNPTAVVGADAEEDEPLRTRCRELLGARSTCGPVDAYAFALRSARRSDGSAIGVTRVRAVKDGRGLVRLWVATAAGGVSHEDLAALRDAVQRVTPDGVTSEVVSARTTPFDCQYRVWLTNGGGASGEELSATFLRAIAKYLASVPIGGFVVPGMPGGVWCESVTDAIKAARPAIFRVEIVSPVATGPDLPDLLLGVEYVPTLGNVVALSIVEAPQGQVAA